MLNSDCYSIQWGKKKHRQQKNAETGNFQLVSAHLLAVGSFAGSDRLQVELGVSSLHLLHTAVN